MIVEVKFHSGKTKIIPMVESFQMKEMHFIVFREDGKTDIELKDRIDQIKVVGV